ncbi:Smr/MutS family protein [bacterium]|nr:Smr/MutS family protein [candidate division CSSED10-310 bacterium]
MPIEDVIDLHTFDPSETESVLDAYLEAAIEKGFQTVRIIHGRGMGVQRSIVRSYLSRNTRVSRFNDAPAEDGGWGATIVYLDI